MLWEQASDLAESDFDPLSHRLSHELAAHRQRTLGVFLALRLQSDGSGLLDQVFFLVVGASAIGMDERLRRQIQVEAFESQDV